MTFAKTMQCVVMMIVKNALNEFIGRTVKSVIKFALPNKNRGFKVVRIEYPNNNICCLKIIWISSKAYEDETE